MNGILIYDKASAIYNQAGIDIYLNEANALGIHLTLVYYEELSYGVKQSKQYVEYQGKSLENLTFAINRCRDYKLAKHLEFMGIRVFNSSIVNEVGNHKGKTYQFLAGKGIAIPDTQLVANSCLEQVLLTSQEDKIVKAVHGHGGSQVCLYHKNSPEMIASILAIMEGEDVVVQPFIKGKGQDLRVYIIGNKRIGAVLRTATTDFRSNYSLGGKVEAYELTKDQITVVNQILNLIKLDYAGIDFMILEDGSLLFNEVEDVVGARMLYQCTNIDAIALYVKYIKQVLHSNYE